MHIEPKYDLGQDLWYLMTHHEILQERCDACEGKRRVRLHNDKEYDCPACHGHGSFSLDGPHKITVCHTAVEAIIVGRTSYSYNLTHDDPMTTGGMNCELVVDAHTESALGHYNVPESRIDKCCYTAKEDAAEDAATIQDDASAGDFMHMIDQLSDR